MAERTTSYRFTGDFSNLGAGLAAMGKGVNDLGVKLTALDKNGAKMRAGLTTVGAVAGKVGLVAAAGLGIAVAAAANFDAAMSKVQAATGESAAAMGDLREAALKAGADTAFSASEAAAGIENLAKAGVSTKDILAGGLSGALDLAAAGELDVATAAEAAATAMTQFKLSGADVPHIADLLAAGAGKAQGEVTDLSAALNQSGLVAGQMGMSIEETTGSLAAFAAAGLLGSDAGTSLKTMLLRLANPSAEAAAEMERFGISAYDAQGNMRPMAEIAEQLKTGFEGQSQATRDAALATIFGSDAIRAANVLYSEGAAGITDWTGKVDDAGYAAETAATKLDNLKGDLDEFIGSLESALIGTGDGAQGPLRSLVQDATKAVNAFNDLSPAAKQVAGSLLGITAVLGGGLWFTSKVFNGIASAKVALAQLGIEGGKTTGVLGKVSRAAGIAAGALAGLAIVDAAQGGMKDYTIGVEEMTGALLGLQEVGDLPDQLEGLGDSIERLANPNMAQDLQDNIAGVLGFGGGSELAESTAQIQAIDAALASLVADGNAELAAALLEDIGLDESQMDDLLSLAPQYSEALAGLANDAAMAGYSLAALPDSIPDDSIWASFYGAADAAAGATNDLAGAAYRAAAATDEEAAALRDGVKAMREKTSATLAAFDAETAYRQALKAARAQGDKNSAGIKGNSDAAIENRGVISALASAWNNQSDAVKNNGERFRQARSDFIETARAMGVPKAAAKALADQILDIPQKRAIKITADTAAAKAAAAELKARIDEATRDRVVTVRIQRLGDMGIGPDRINDGTDGVPEADGGTVPKTGKPYADRHHYLLADGEEVISNRNGQADRHRGLLKAINAGRLAGGGTAGVDWRDTHASQGGRGSGDMWTDIDLFGSSLRDLARALKDSEKALDKERQQRDNLISKRDELSSGIRSGLGGDIWAGASNPWASGATSDPTSILQQQGTAADEFIRLVKQLKGKGLDGAALAEVISSGDVERARMMAALPASALNSFERTYNTTQRKLAAAAMAGGQAMGYSAQIAESNAELRELRAEVRAVKQELKSRDKAADRREERADRSRQSAADRAAEHNRRGAARGARSRPNG